MMGTHHDGRADALSMIKDDIDQFRLEPAMQEKVRNHYDHLQRLAADLQKLGVDDGVIDRHVIEIFDRYRTELLRNIERLASR